MADMFLLEMWTNDIRSVKVSFLCGVLTVFFHADIKCAYRGTRAADPPQQSASDLLTDPRMNNREGNPSPAVSLGSGAAV